jgi:integrase/recombinase XerD
MPGTVENWLTMYMHIQAHLEHCKAREFSDNTMQTRWEVLERVHRRYGDLHKITAQQLATFLAGPQNAKRKWSAQTKATYFNHLAGYYSWARRVGLMQVNPMELLDRPRVPYKAPRRTSPDAFARIRREAVEPYLTAALLARFAGLRCAEICRANRTDVTRERIRVLGKGGRVDEIPTHPEIWGHVAGRTGLLVRDTHGQEYRPNTMSRIFGKYVREQLGLDLTLHRLRHLYANTLRQVRLPDGSAIDMEVIRTLTRHRSLASLQIYLCAGDEERQAAIRALPIVA